MDMDLNALWVIVLLGLVLFGGEIKFHGLFHRPRHRPGNRELTNDKRELLDE